MEMTGHKSCCCKQFCTIQIKITANTPQFPHMVKAWAKDRWCVWAEGKIFVENYPKIRADFAGLFLTPKSWMGNIRRYLLFYLMELPFWKHTKVFAILPDGVTFLETYEGICYSTWWSYLFGNLRRYLLFYLMELPFWKPTKVFAILPDGVTFLETYEGICYSTWWSYLFGNIRRYLLFYLMELPFWKHTKVFAILPDGVTFLETYEGICYSTWWSYLFGNIRRYLLFYLMELPF